MLDAVLFRDLSVRDPARVVQVQLLEGNDPTRVSYPLFRELGAHQQVLEGFFATSDYPVPTPEGAKGYMASGGYFRTLGVAARLGRLFTDQKDKVQRTGWRSASPSSGHTSFAASLPGKGSTSSRVLRLPGHGRNFRKMMRYRDLCALGSDPN